MVKLRKWEKPKIELHAWKNSEEHEVSVAEDRFSKWQTAKIIKTSGTKQGETVPLNKIVTSMDAR